jgi:hypothetical protein
MEVVQLHAETDAIAQLHLGTHRKIGIAISKYGIICE